MEMHLEKGVEKVFYPAQAHILHRLRRTFNSYCGAFVGTGSDFEGAVEHAGLLLHPMEIELACGGEVCLVP